ncbi:MAG: hypothetical protein LBR96_01930 [Treponema sp.]|nr:hypothetical protein [Treponema sp.]
MEFVPLNSGALAYVYVDMAASRLVLDASDLAGLRDKHAAEILDRTGNAVLALFPGNSEMAIQAFAWGSYPAARANFSLFFSKAWKKYKSERGSSFWFSADDGISLALKKDRAFLGLKNRNVRGLPTEEVWEPWAPIDPFGPYPGRVVPDGFRAYREGAALALWVDDPASNMGAVLEALSIPLQIPAESCFVALDPLEKEGFSGRIRMEFSQSSQARAILVLMTMARALMPGMEGRLEGTAALASLIFANPPQQEGSAINLITAPLGTDEIALLFRMFSVSSK